MLQESLNNFLFSLKKILLMCCQVKTAISVCMILRRRQKFTEVCQLIYMDGSYFLWIFVMLIVLANSFKCVICCAISSSTINLHFDNILLFSSLALKKKRKEKRTLGGMEKDLKGVGIV